jgi:hypothetical protein
MSMIPLPACPPAAPSAPEPPSVATRWLPLAILWLTTLTGCRGMSYADTTALLGAGLGAVTGAAIGDHSGNAGPGAVIGAATGAIAGGLIGSAEDARVERDAALAQLASARSNPPLTNHDLVYMAQNGLGDDVIVSAIHSRGGQFDLTPAGLVQLRQSGVSERVILAAQSAPAPRPVANRTTIIRSEPEVIYVPPRPRAYFVFGSGHHHYYRHHHHCW